MNSLLYLETVDSTNHFFKTHLADFMHGTSVRAGFQTAGRGLAQNSWESDAGKNLLMSTLIFPHIPATEQFKVNMLYTRGIYEVLSQFQGIKVKWPNDIYYNDRKLGGILIEHGIEGEHIKYSICGIGLNLNQTEFSNQRYHRMNIFADICFSRCLGKYPARAYRNNNDCRCRIWKPSL